MLSALKLKFRVLICYPTWAKTKRGNFQLSYIFITSIINKNNLRTIMQISGWHRNNESHNTRGTSHLLLTSVKKCQCRAKIKDCRYSMWSHNHFNVWFIKETPDLWIKLIRIEMSRLKVVCSDILFYEKPLEQNSICSQCIKNWYLFCVALKYLIRAIISQSNVEGIVCRRRHLS